MININSDDFGYSPQINKATYLAFKENLINSTSTLVNFKKGFNDALHYILAEKIDRNAIGIHLNISEGIPLTKKIQNNSKFCLNGGFNKRTSLPTLHLNSYDKTCVSAELKAQIEHFITSCGFLPSHIDSHHHLHVEWGFTPIVVSLAKAYGITNLRLAQNTGMMAFPKKIYREWINRYIQLKGLATMDKFGSIDDIIFSGIEPNKKYEVMVHAILSNECFKILDAGGQKLELKISKLLDSKPCEL